MPSRLRSEPILNAGRIFDNVAAYREAWRKEIDIRNVLGRKD
jgi:hypothetical protein